MNRKTKYVWAMVWAYMHLLLGRTCMDISKDRRCNRPCSLIGCTSVELNSNRSSTFTSHNSRQLFDLID